VKHRLTGLVPACYTPMHEDGTLNLDQVPAIVNHLASSGVSALYVAGTSGEGASLTGEERRLLAGAFVAAAKGRLPVIVQVGHNSLVESQQLAEHAQRIGADAVSAMPPSYFKPASVDVLVSSMAEIAAAIPGLPFYYYHIPRMTGVVLDMAEFLDKGSQKIANLVGLKFSDPKASDCQACVELEGGRFTVLWGLDEMLLSALAVGVRGLIGSTYNIAAPLYLRIIKAFEAGDREEARRLQFLSVQMIRTLNRHAPFHCSMKIVLKMIGVDCGPCRLPLERPHPEAPARIRKDLEAIGFFQWSR